MNHKHFGIKIQSEIKQNKIKFNRTKIYNGRDILILTDELELCDDGNVLSNKDNLLKVDKLLCVEAKTCDEITNNGWNMAGIETEGRKNVQSKKIFKAFSDKIAHLICPENPTFHQHDDVQGEKIYQ